VKRRSQCCCLTLFLLMLMLLLLWRPVQNDETEKCGASEFFPGNC
jgi:hypothetical protein